MGRDDEGAEDVEDVEDVKQRNAEQRKSCCQASITARSSPQRLQNSTPLDIQYYWLVGKGDVRSRRLGSRAYHSFPETNKRDRLDAIMTVNC